MEFKDLPLKVQEIAAQCLADKISYATGFAEGAVKNEPAKDQARQVRGAFIELYSQPTSTAQLVGVDSSVFTKLRQMEEERMRLIAPLYAAAPENVDELPAPYEKGSSRHLSSGLQDEDSLTQAVRGLCFFVLHLTKKEEQ